ncbi:MAG: hypothetical protein IJV31_02360 [Clostridia bacterium]|nr:hypothetical protein [Clostridia bacterium]
MEKNYWLHRITGGDNALPFAYQLLFKHNYLSIGWSDLSSTKFISRVKNEGISVINKKWKIWGGDYLEIVGAFIVLLKR